MSYPYVCIDRDGNRHYTDVRIVNKLPEIGKPYMFCFGSEARNIIDVKPFVLPDHQVEDMSRLDFYTVTYIPNNLTEETTKIIAIRREAVRFREGKRYWCDRNSDKTLLIERRTEKTVTVRGAMVTTKQILIDENGCEYFNVWDPVKGMFRYRAKNEC